MSRGHTGTPEPLRQESGFCEFRVFRGDSGLLEMEGIFQSRIGIIGIKSRIIDEGFVGKVRMLAEKVRENGVQKS